MRNFLKVAIILMVITNAITASAQSSNGQVPCSKFLEWQRQDPKYVQRYFGEYLSAVIDGINIQRAWLKAAPDQIIAPPSSSNAISFIVNYCINNEKDILVFAAAAMASAIVDHKLSEQKK